MRTPAAASVSEVTAVTLPGTSLTSVGSFWAVTMTGGRVTRGCDGRGLRQGHRATARGKKHRAKDRADPDPGHERHPALSPRGMPPETANCREAGTNGIADRLSLIQ